MYPGLNGPWWIPLVVVLLVVSALLWDCRRERV